MVASRSASASEFAQIADGPRELRPEAFTGQFRPATSVLVLGQFCLLSWRVEFAGDNFLGPRRRSGTLLNRRSLHSHDSGWREVVETGLLRIEYERVLHHTFITGSPRKVESAVLTARFQYLP